jgi:hypothetical protein
MSSAEERARELLAQARGEPSHSPARVETLLEAVRAAEAAGHESLTYEARRLLIDAAMWSGRIREMLMAFAAQLAQCDRMPAEFPESDLHWRYKWILDWVPCFPQITREQIAELQKDAERRFARVGEGGKALAMLRARQAGYLGDRAVVDEQYALWKRLTRDSLSDCLLCDQDSEVETLLWLERDEAAVQAARAIVRRGRSCTEVPHITYARALPPMLRLGLREDAVAWQRLGYGRLRTLYEKNVRHLGEHLSCTAVVGDLGRGLRILRASLEGAARHPAAYSRMIYLVGAALLLERVGEDRAKVKLAVPVGFGGDGASRSQDVADVARSFARQAQALASSFDDRNGNRAISASIHDLWRFRELRLPGPVERE